MVLIIKREMVLERDYIHVMALAFGHMQALNAINNLEKFQILNLGTGKGTTVTELIRTFEKINNFSVATKFVKSGPGDVAKSFADPALARELIGFKCHKTLEDICSDT